ncbi:MAG: ATP-dependent zinc metalloprotease FtsH [Actinomyces sp.]|uniref:ATP-dependent zinc metalloprotease FtsH n=1 Tax=Schaalia sp. ORNL0103 TaxID=2789426 RepID=UPI001CA50A48|nr:ATP-dependent zinc metalloprotease FtsH [Schaalia sp. ORNL0103]MBS7159109.1 ATP-dependent zinc metalloprotease FtsH [Actinomyces sp.]MBW6413633.1 ATP-dependent zinc metalloprotease FtsH [Schaalia sp. ORNL0103]
MNEKIKNKRPSLGWVMVPLIMLLAGGWFMWGFFAPRAVTTSEGLALISGDTVERVVLNEGTQQVNLTLTENYVHQSTGGDDKTVDLGKDVYFTYSYVQTKDILDTVADKAPAKGWNAVRPQSGILGGVVQLLISLVILGVAFYFIMRSMSGSRMMGGFTQSRAKEFNQERPDVTFADVAGEDEAVEELEEIREFLASPDKFHKVGARIPRGVLLYGPPGTGKTLLAKAVAGEANAPFFSISGSEFMELYVGVGASRVRELFERAKKNAPAIIFVDEIDAVGRHRGSGIGGGNDEREQTLNQLLVEMDGFDERANIILIAATNRPDILDPALLRPGRFDRQIAVEAPDLKGREAILKVHAQGKPLTEQVDLRQIAKRTPGFTGADLANVLNEAALLTARSNMQFIDERAIDEAIDRVIAGPQKRTRVMNDHDKAVTAYHEAGHALAAAALNYTDPVTKVTILPRGRALGYTMVMPTEDRFNKTRNQLLDDLVYGMGGRVAEEIVFRDPSTGPANDIQQATKTARAMVTDYGMSDRIGMVKLGDADTEAFGHGSGEGPRAFSDETAAIIDEEVRRLLDNAMREAWRILSENRAVLDTLASRLLEEETLDEAQLAEIFKDVVKAPERPVWNYQSDAAVPGVLLGNPVGVGSAEASATSEVSFEAPSIDVSDVMDTQTNEGEEQA